MTIKVRRDFLKERIARIQPVRAVKSSPYTLRNYVRLREFLREARRNYAVVTWKNRSDPQAAHVGETLSCRFRPCFKQLHTDGPSKTAHVSHQLPILVRRQRNPIADLSIRVSKITKCLVQHEICSALYQDCIDSTRRQ